MTNEISSFILQGGGGQIGTLPMLLPMLAIFGIFYMLLILPQQRKQKRWQQMIGELKTGDRVTTGGGIRGTIIAIKDDALHLRVPPDNLRLEVSKASIVSVARDEEQKKSSEK
ncbi:MAG TPA: preprotein translocase subunit YajC [Candidatus Angelobacter sp.]|jgi:preprotein translocase subunit YajC|nr:preprotein translocase subunit YajC [Candidatus Angelobacter sp.]